MKTTGFSRWFRIIMTGVLAVIVCAGAPPAVQPAQAGTDENPIVPETISAGEDHTCGIKSDGTLACWGRNDYGQSTPPGGTFRQVSAGEYHTCGVKSDGTLACWGSNDWGQSTLRVPSVRSVQVHCSPAG